MKTKIKSELIFTLIFLLASFNFALPANGGKIIVTVNFFLPNGQTQPLPGATAKLLDKSKKTLREEITNDSGEVIFNNLQPGEYFVQ